MSLTDHLKNELEALGAKMLTDGQDSQIVDKVGTLILKDSAPFREKTGPRAIALGEVDVNGKTFILFA